MTDIMFRKFNATGRKFICLNNRPGLVDDDEFNQHFQAGKIYVEAEVDADEQNHILPGEDVLLLLTREGLTLYVDACDFVLSEQRISPLALLPFCVN